MEDNKIDINSLIGFFLIGLIFIGWLYLNPPPPSTEVVQTIDNDESVVEEPVEQDLSDILSWFNVLTAPAISGTTFARRRNVSKSSTTLLARFVINNKYKFSIGWLIYLTLSVST